MSGIKVKTHNVAILARNGSEAHYVLHISSDGLDLVLQDNVISHFPYEAIRQWRPSETRSKSQGGQDCFDLQIETNKGPRDLRLKCASTQMRNQILEDLHGTVQELLQRQQMEAPQNLSPKDAANDRVPRAEKVDKGESISVTGQLQGSRQFEGAPIKMPVRMETAMVPSPSPTSASQDMTSNQDFRDYQRVQYAYNPEVQAQVSEAQPTRLAVPFNPDQPTIISPARTPTTEKYENKQVSGSSPTIQALGQRPPTPPLSSRAQELEDALGRMSSSGLSHLNAIFDSQFAARPRTFPLLQPLSALESELADPAQQISSSPDPPARPDPNLPADRTAAVTRLPAVASPPPSSRFGNMPEAVVGRDSPPFQFSGSRSELEELRTQNRFLEGVVKRLCEELSRHLGTTGLGAISEAELLSDDGTPLPSWIKDQRYLNPLLTAYDARLQTLDGEVKERNKHIVNLQKQVEDVLSENEGLRSELSRAMQLQGMAMEESTTVAPRSAGFMSQENELLRQENDLLMTQHSDLEAEIKRLHSQVEDRTAENLQLLQDQGMAMSRASQATSLVKDFELRLERSQSSLRVAEERCEALLRKVQETGSTLEEERIGHAAARRNMEDLGRSLQAAQTEVSASQARLKAAQDAQAVLQVELSATRERLESSTADAASAHRAADQLRAALASIESRLVDYQRKDAEVYSRIKEAMEAAEESRLARDAAVMHQKELEREVESLNAKLTSARVSVKETMSLQMREQVLILQSQLSDAQEDAQRLESQNMELRAANERLQRDIRALNNELASTKEDMGETLLGRTRASYLSIGATEKMAEVERERDEAVQKMESLQRQMARHSRDWQLEKSQLERELADGKRRMTEAEGNAGTARGEAAGANRTLEAARREVAALKAARAQTEAEMRQQLAAVRADRDLEVRSLATKLEATVAACQSSVGEAERVLEAKEKLLARWKEEAEMMATKLERMQAEHQREIGDQARELAALASALESARAANVVLTSEIAEMQSANSAAAATLEEMEGRTLIVASALAAAESKQEEMAQDMRALQALLERAKLEKARAERARDVIASKYDVLAKRARVEHRL